MKAVIQRVNSSELRVEGKLISSIERGLLIFLGIHSNDTVANADYLISKIVKMRIFSDEEGKMNRSIADVNGEVMIVSQFTLYADTKKGNRPSFIQAARPELAIPLYEYFIAQCEQALGKKVAQGVFGADMKINLINDGPVTIVMEG